MDEQENKQNKQQQMPAPVVSKLELIRELAQNCKYDDALEQLELLQEEEPENYEINYELARVYFELGDYESAVSNYEILLEHHQSPIMYYNLGMALEANDEVDKAIGAYLKCLALNEKFALAYKKLGMLYMARGDFDDAIEYFSDYLKLDVPECEEEVIQGVLERLKG